MFVDYRGLTVAEVTELRNECRKAGVEYVVLKNTMIELAAKELGIEGLDSYRKGPTAVAFGHKDPASPAKILSDFIKTTKKMELKCAVIDKQTLDCGGRAGTGRSAAEGGPHREDDGQPEMRRSRTLWACCLQRCVRWCTRSKRSGSKRAAKNNSRRVIAKTFSKQNEQ